MRILVAEDERKVASFIRQGLEEEGHAVEVAGDGESALVLAAHGPPFDLVVLDVMLPQARRLFRPAGAARREGGDAGAHADRA
jgi:DNA-binding response OmpR family regulator